MSSEEQRYELIAQQQARTPRMPVTLYARQDQARQEHLQVAAKHRERAMARAEQFLRLRSDRPAGVITGPLTWATGSVE